MSFPTTETIFGIIEFENKTYDLLSQPLEDEQFKKIKKYKKENNCGSSSAPWSVNKYKWKVKDSKLYLQEIYFKLCKDKSNHIKNIFTTTNLFASWVSVDVKLLVAKQDIDKKLASREVIILNIENGVIFKATHDIEEYNIPKLRTYINI
ncbi:MAG: hypothetical protein U9Q66_02070 [Patescibacteria group bacterium]|nr:hypothetical protein [Patescibacteria group bacterium]